METEEGIRRVVWLPKELDKQIEEIRRKIGYSRSGIYRYILTRFLEREIFTRRKQVHLRPWEEIIGTLKAIETNSQTISAIINCTQDLEISITYPKGTAEADILKNLNNHLGQKIAILKTDDLEKPIIIRTINECIKTPNNIEATVPTVITDKSPEILQKEIPNKEAPKNRQKKQAPTTNLDPHRWRSIFGSLGMIWNFC